MNRRDCVDFLQWCLPRLRMRWAGFRKVSNQVCKRLDRRLRILGLDDIGAYRAYLDAHPEEWSVVDGLTRITISRFYRDRQVFERLERTVLPACAQAADEAARPVIRVCSLGCGSGEEPYSIALVWSFRVQPRFPNVGLKVVAVDADPQLLQRAHRACYGPGSMKALPEDLRQSGFVETSEGLCLRPPIKHRVEFIQADIRDGAPNGRYDIVLCRNLAFTYFDQSLQEDIAQAIHDALRPGGVLVTGAREALPRHHPYESDLEGGEFHWRPVTS